MVFHKSADSTRRQKGAEPLSSPSAILSHCRIRFSRPCCRTIGADKVRADSVPAASGQDWSNFHPARIAVCSPAGSVSAAQTKCPNEMGVGIAADPLSPRLDLFGHIPKDTPSPFGSAAAPPDTASGVVLRISVTGPNAIPLRASAPGPPVASPASGPRPFAVLLEHRSRQSAQPLLSQRPGQSAWIGIPPGQQLVSLRHLLVTWRKLLMSLRFLASSSSPYSHDDVTECESGEAGSTVVRLWIMWISWRRFAGAFVTKAT